MIRATTSLLVYQRSKYYIYIYACISFLMNVSKVKKNREKNIIGNGPFKISVAYIVSM